MPTEATYIVCPLCGLNRKLEKSGEYVFGAIGQLIAKGRIRFDELDPATAPFVDIRQIKGKQRKVDPLTKGNWGFFRIRFLTLSEAKASGLYDDLLDQIREQSTRVLQVLQAPNGRQRRKRERKQR